MACARPTLRSEAKGDEDGCNQLGSTVVCKTTVLTLLSLTTIFHNTLFRFRAQNTSRSPRRETDREGHTIYLYTYDRVHRRERERIIFARENPRIVCGPRSARRARRARAPGALHTLRSLPLPPTRHRASLRTHKIDKSHHNSTTALTPQKSGRLLISPALAGRARGTNPRIKVYIIISSLQDKKSISILYH